MRDLELFQMALGLTAPWYVTRTSFDAGKKRLDIYQDFHKGGRFACPECGASDCPAYDSEERTWRHLNFFEHVSYLHARTPRIDCARCGVRAVAVPWGRRESGFTLLFEAFVMTLASQMPMRAIARLVKEHDTRLWRIVHHYVEKARSEQDHGEVEEVGIDETASRRGHRYITTFVDLDRARVLFATPGKDASTLGAFRHDLEAHGGDPGQIAEVCCDMSPAFIAGVENAFPEARITFDRFHVTRIVNDAVDQVRRAEQKTRPELKNSRYLWLKHPQRLTARQQERLEDLRMNRQHLKTVRAFQIKLAFQELYDQPPALAEAFLKKWYFWATHSRLPAVIDAARTIKRHWNGVLRWFATGISNGVLEGINSLIQAAKARARGYRSDRNLITMVYLIAGKLDMRLPT